WIVQGGGSGIGGSADQLHYRYQGLSGDGTLVARIASVGNTDPAAKAGIMLRGGLDAGAAFADVVRTPAGGLSVQFRASPGADAVTVPFAGPGTSSWVKLARNDSVVSGYVSATGTDGTWTLVGTATLRLSSPVDLGLVVTAQSSSALNTSTFTGLVAR